MRLTKVCRSSRGVQPGPIPAARVCSSLADRLAGRTVYRAGPPEVARVLDAKAAKPTLHWPNAGGIFLRPCAPVRITRRSAHERSCTPSPTARRPGLKPKTPGLLGSGLFVSSRQPTRPGARARLGANTRQTNMPWSTRQTRCKSRAELGANRPRKPQVRALRGAKHRANSQHRPVVAGQAAAQRPALAFGSWPPGA
jgi:hypothetical protein